MTDDKELILQAIEAQKKLKDIPFGDMIGISTGKKLIPLNISGDPMDNELYGKITYAIKSYLAICKKTHRRLRGDRINEVGKAIESEFVQELQRGGLKVTLLAEAGYPDMKVVDSHDRITYLESKATSKGWNSGFRSFYFTSGKKIESDARHLLIGWSVTEETAKYWVIVGCKLVDLNTISLQLKSEFNADNAGLYKTPIFSI